MKRIFQILILMAGVAGTANAQTGEGQATFGLEHIEALRATLGGYPLWQYAAMALWVVLAFLAAPVVDFIMTRVLKRLTSRTETDLDDKLLDVMHKPVRVAVVLIVMSVGVGAYSWPVKVQQDVDRFLIIGIAIAVIYIATRVVDLLLERMKARLFSGDGQLAEMMMPVMAKTLKVFVIIIGVLTTAQHLGFPVASVIAGLGIGGVAVALAAQNTLANIFGSVVILIDRPFRVGDHVKIDTSEGLVEGIGLRSTKIRSADGHVITIPNKIVADVAVVNIKSRPNTRQVLNIGLTYDTTPEKMQEAVELLREIYQKHPLTHEVWVFWKDFSLSSLDIQVVYWCKSTQQREFLAAMQEINLEIKRRFAAAGLSFAFPTQTIQLQQIAGK